MNAAAIIEEIKHLPPIEREQVVDFVQTLEVRQLWNGRKLTEYEKRMVETNDPVEAQRLKEKIITSFFEGGPGAWSPPTQRAPRGRGPFGRPGA